jgi:hypothetical protein
MPAENAASTEDMVARLRARIPKSLDDVFRANRDVGTIAIASNDQLAPLRQSIAGKVVARARVKDWRFVAITIDEPDQGAWFEYVYLVGYNEGAPWVTSAIKAYDRRRRLLRTVNSYYRLAGPRGDGDLPEVLLINLCAAFHHWGLAPLFGVPRILF